MKPPFPSTRFADAPPRVALLLIAWTTAAIAWCFYFSWTDEGLAQGRGFKSFKDYHFYADVVDSVRAGQGYYEALPSLFAKYRYTTFSVFNFRTPFYAYANGGIPELSWGEFHVNLLSLLAVTAVVLGTWVLAREGGPIVAITGLVFLLGALGWGLIGPVYLFAEFWAGVLIALSVSCEALGNRPLGILTALAALFFRELALPYYLVGLVLALRRRRWTELAGWVGGLLVYGAFMFWHVERVRPLLATGEGEGLRHWLRFGGPTFLLETCQVNFLQSFLLPWWASAIYLPLAVLGLAGWRGDTGSRVAATVAIYLAAFSVVGQWFNAYWGLLYMPLLALGAAWAPLALRDLYVKVQSPKSKVQSQTKQTSDFGL